MSNGHAKGSEFERVIAKLIVKAFKHHGIEQSECWRSVMSGGHEMSSGDLRMSDRLTNLFPYVPECKFHKKIIWRNFWLHPSYMQPCKEQRWLVQAAEGAAKHSRGLAWILVVKENRSEIFAVYETIRHGLVVAPFEHFLLNRVRQCDKVRK
jgi:hypothetical protein